jgi:hypothetical protein
LFHWTKTFFVRPRPAETSAVRTTGLLADPVGTPRCIETEWTEKYRTLDGSVHYTFGFRQLTDGTFHLYTIGPLELLEVGDPVHIFMDHGKRRICWSTAIKSVQKAKYVAAKWAEAFERYRKDGKFR